MSVMSSVSTAAVSFIQPRLSHVLTHLQPDIPECVPGTDLSSLRLVHLTLGRNRSLLIQLSTMNDAAHLRVVLFDRGGQLASLGQCLPQTLVMATSKRDMLPLLHQAERAGKGVGRAPVWVVVVNEFLDLRSDAYAWGAFRAQVERGHEWGTSLIALSREGDNDINALFRYRIAFAPSPEGASVSSGLSNETQLAQLNAQRQRGQFLLEDLDEQATLAVRTLTLPPVDVPALHANDLDGRYSLHGQSSPVPCAGLETLRVCAGVGTETGDSEEIAVHIRSCPRCRHGILPLPRPLPGISPLSCSACHDLFPVYDEATRPDHSQVTMPHSNSCRLPYTSGSARPLRHVG